MKPTNNIEFLQQLATISIEFSNRVKAILSDKERLEYIKSDRESFHSVVIGILLNEYRACFDKLSKALEEVDNAYDERFLSGLDLDILLKQ